MNEFNEGDLVEAVKGETVIRGRVADKGYFFQDGPSLVAYRDRGFTFTLIESAPKPLPTETGSVVRFSCDGDRRRLLFWLAGDGTWDAIDYRGKGHSRVADPFAFIREQGLDYESHTVLS